MDIEELNLDIISYNKLKRLNINTVEDFHARFTALREEYEDKLKETQESADEDKDKQEFKVFLVMAHDALTRLTAIANTHADEPVYAEKLRGLLEKFSKMLEA